MAKPLWTVSLVGLAATLLLTLLGSTTRLLSEGVAGLGWADAHREAALYGALLPGVLALTASLVGRHAPRAMEGTESIAMLLGAGVSARVVGALLQPSNLFTLVWVAGGALLAAAGFLFFKSLRAALPPRGVSVVDVARDPLTKGDDACFLQLKLGAMFLLLGLATQLIVAVAGTFGPLRAGWGLAADHLLLVGFGLPTLFGLSHLMVPRLSGVPAIAAGAIKGELHSTLLGVTLLTFGFALGWKPLIIAGGLVVFFAAFVFMGVLGANIMKNKSKTQRVTPGFAYIPWVFAGVLWVVVGVLLGLFLNIVPSLFADRLPALRTIHVHLMLFGGFLQLGLAFAARTLAATPVPFSKHKWSFYALNIALGLLAWGALADSATLMAESAGLALLGLAAWFFPLRRHAELVMG